MGFTLWALVVVAIICLSDFIMANPFPGPWQRYIHSPESRTVHPKSIYRTQGNVSDAEAMLNPQSTKGALLQGGNSFITLDFGQMTAGILTVRFGKGVSIANHDNPQELVGVAFSESEQFVGIASDDSNDFRTSWDGTLMIPVPAELPGEYNFLMKDFENASEETVLEPHHLSNHYTAAPNVPEDRLRHLPGYFYCSNELLNRIWYAGAYTVQLNTIGSHTARVNNETIIPDGSVGLWFNNASITPNASDVVLVDGAKRDRSVGSGGDYFIAIEAAFLTAVEKENLLSARNGLQSTFDMQYTVSGALPYAAKPFSDMGDSDTYHLWNLVNVHTYYMHTGDTDFVKRNWAKYCRAMDYSLKKVNRHRTGLLNVTAPNSWARLGGDGENIAANVLLYGALTKGAELADAINEDPRNWTSLAKDLKVAINKHLWVESAGLYKDNTTAAGAQLYLQDGNVLAIILGVADAERSARISQGLQQFWMEYGAVASEAAGIVSPFFISSEILAHFLANPGDATAALEIMRRQWGYMLNKFSNSTVIEGHFRDGRLHYPFYNDRDTYISFAHTWCAGPTTRLTTHVLGLSMDAPLGKQWRFQPVVNASGVSFAKGGFVDSLGKFEAGWSQQDSPAYKANIQSPQGTTGTIGVPTFGKTNRVTVQLNGKDVWRKGKPLDAASPYNVTSDDHYVYLSVPGGSSYTIVSS